nr:uncharacterized protein LOC111510856 [Leptinotarsa decemlineata]XP_023022580.1 uncharacterized protein LOC111510856 [Leptinotarsa decemlineata]
MDGTDVRNGRSRSTTPFTLADPNGDFIAKESYMTSSSERTTRRMTALRSKKIFSSGEVSSFMEKPVRKSTRSERSTRKWFKTSDYSSEDGENEITSTQNEKNQLVEDARVAANGSHEVSALNLYKKSGRYWDVYPKTDWTYSLHSKDRIELAPGIVAMPNMSRKTIHSVQSAEGSHEFAHKETNTEVLSRYNESKSFGECIPRQLFNSNYNNENKSYKRTSFIHHQWTLLKRICVSTFTSIITTLYFIFRIQTNCFATLHTFTSRIMLMDTWLLWKNGTGNKTSRLVTLCLVPLLLLGGCCLLKDLGRILQEAYSNTTSIKSLYPENMLLYPGNSVPSQRDDNIALNEPLVDSQVGILQKGHMAFSSAAELNSELTDKQFEMIYQSLNEKYNVDEMLKESLARKNLLTSQQKIIDDLQNEIYKLKQDMQEIEKSRKEDLTEIVSQFKADNIKNIERLNHNLNRCCRKPIGDYKAYIKLALIDLLNDAAFIENQKGLNHYLHTICTAKKDLDSQLINLTSNFNSTFSSSIEDNSMGLLDTISENIRLEMNNDRTKTDHQKKETSSVSNISEEHVKRIVKNALLIYDADKTGLVDYAMETMGGQILTTRCTENYHYGKAVVSVLGVPLWYPVNSPRTIITPSINPGECWAFQNFPGFAVIRLSKRIKVEAFSLEHISKLLVPNGEIDSAPKQFEVYGLTDQDDKEPLKLGEYVYEDHKESLQFFPVQNVGHIFEIIELRVLSNWGNPNYTCLYRFRVHGKSNF